MLGLVQILCYIFRVSGGPIPVLFSGYAWIHLCPSVLRKVSEYYRLTSSRSRLYLQTPLLQRAMVQLRVTFNIAEYFKGLTSTIMHDEAYRYCLDSLPTLIAILLLKFRHPENVVASKESAFSREEGP